MARVGPFKKSSEGAGGNTVSREQGRSLSEQEGVLHSVGHWFGLVL